MGKTHRVPVAALVGAKEHALRQVAAGVDILVVQGTEAGGHCGEVSTMVLVPEVIKAIKPIRDVPVLAAGGIMTGRQMAACMAMGAAGAWTGSVWLATVESETSEIFREKMIAASSRDAIVPKAVPASQRGSCARSGPTPGTRGPGSPGALPMPLQSIISRDAFHSIDRSAAAGNAQARDPRQLFRRPGRRPDRQREIRRRRGTGIQGRFYRRDRAHERAGGGVEGNLAPSLRAKRSNPVLLVATGLLRFARNDDEQITRETDYLESKARKKCRIRPPTPEDRIPVIVGIGEIVDRPRTSRMASSRLRCWNRRSQRAEADSGGKFLGEIGSLDIVNFLSWRYQDPARQLSERLGIKPQHAYYGPVGGESPIRYLHEAAQRIARGECSVAAVCGAEAPVDRDPRPSAPVSSCHGRRLPRMSRNPSAAPRSRSRSQSSSACSGRYRFIRSMRPLPRRNRGQTPREAMAESGQLWSTYSDVAAQNPSSLAEATFCA